MESKHGLVGVRFASARGLASAINDRGARYEMGVAEAGRLVDVPASGEEMGRKGLDAGQGWMVAVLRKKARYNLMCGMYDTTCVL